MAHDIQLNDLLRLPHEERARLAKALIESLEETAEEDAEKAWIEELEKRAFDVRNNPQGLSDWSEVRERLAARLRDR